MKTSETLGVGKPKPKPKSRKAQVSLPARVAMIAVAAVAGLGAIYWFNTSGRGPSTGKYRFEVGSPGPGQVAPPIKLASDIGGTFDLTNMRGRTVLLYFQEGLTCQPCWDQIKDIEKNGLHTPILSDPDLAVSNSYRANSYGMMGASRDGHTFIVIGPDGQIKWRADYGGAPDYTMYLPVRDLVADLRRGLGKPNG